MASPSRVEHPDGVTAETLRSAGLSAPQNRSPLREVDENEEQPRQRERDQPLIPPPHVGQYQERDPYYEQPNDRAGFYEREDQFEPRRRNAPRENFFDQRGREVPRDDYYEPRRMNAPRENYRGWQNQRQGGNQGGNSSYNTYRGNSTAQIPPQRDGPYRPPPTQRVGGYPPRDEPPRESFEEKMLRMMTDIKQEVSTVKHDMGHMRQEWKQEIRQEVSTVRQEISNYRQESTSSIRNLENQMAQGSTSKSPIEEENVKIHVEENAEQNTGTVAPAGSDAEKALEKGKEKADVPNFELVDDNLVDCVNDESLDVDEFDNVDSCACDAISVVENDNVCCDMNGEVEEEMVGLKRVALVADNVKEKQEGGMEESATVTMPRLLCHRHCREAKGVAAPPSRFGGPPKEETEVHRCCS
nr:uncharacterized protein LOC109155206 [Ipomoea batatas]